MHALECHSSCDIAITKTRFASAVSAQGTVVNWSPLMWGLMWGLMWEFSAIKATGAKSCYLGYINPLYGRRNGAFSPL